VKPQGILDPLGKRFKTNPDTDKDLKRKQSYGWRLPLMLH
jgi:hypothetical protein